MSSTQAVPEYCLIKRYNFAADNAKSPRTSQAETTNTANRTLTPRSCDNVPKRVVRGWLVSAAGLLALAVLGSLVVIESYDETLPHSIVNERVQSDRGSATALVGDGAVRPRTSVAVPARLPVRTPESLSSAARATDLDSIFVTLYSADPDAVIAALDAVAQSASEFFLRDEFVRRVEELSNDADQAVAEQAQRVMLEFVELESAQDARSGQALVMAQGSAMPSAEEPTMIRDPSPPVAGDGPGGIAADADAASTDVGDRERREEAALQDPDPRVRAHALEDVASRFDEHAAQVLLAAMRDPDADNRLMAIEGLGSMVERGIEDADAIMSELRQASGDPDPRVAESAQQMIRDLSGEAP